MRVPTLLYIRMLAGGANQIPGTPVPLNGQANAVVIGRIVELCSGAQLLCYGCNTGASGVSIGHTRLKEGSHLRRLQPLHTVVAAPELKIDGSSKKAAIYDGCNLSAVTNPKQTRKGPQSRQPSTTAATLLAALLNTARSSSKKAAIYDGCNLVMFFPSLS